MERVLIVEDIALTQRGLASALKLLYPGWTLDVADTVEEAKGKIQEGIEQEQPYHVCILDYKLPPRHVGEDPEGSLELSDYALKKLPQCLVIQITSFQDDIEFKDKRIKPMLAEPNDRLRFVPKSETPNSSWATEVATIALKRVLGEPIKELMQEIFGEEHFSETTGYRARNVAVLRRSRSLTQSLSALQYEIGRSWPYLPEDMKEEIKTKIKVDETTTPVTIAMFTPETIQES